jgi:putative PIN family toxin of toxin-antitoxin system
MIRVVIDTNGFVSSFFGGLPRKIINLWKNDHIILCLSQDIIEEYLAVLNRFGLDNEQELLNLTRLFAEGYNSVFTAKTSKLDVVKEDAEDNKFIECAVALNSKIIVSGGKHLTSIRKYIDIDIMSPRKFIESHNLD